MAGASADIKPLNACCMAAAAILIRRSKMATMRPMLRKPWIWLAKRSSLTSTCAACKRLGVGFAFVEQRIEAGGDEQGGRQPVQVPPATATRAIGLAVRTAQVVLEEIFDGRMPQEQVSATLMGGQARPMSAVG